jgi:hypothetical protein
MAATDLDEDPGWRLSPRMLLLLVPGYLRLATHLRPSAKSPDGLTMLRQVWLSFTLAVILFGVVVLFIVPATEAQPAGGWVAALAVVTVFCLTADARLARRPIDCRDLSALAQSYRSRFFLRTALSQMIVLIAFVATFVVGQWWICWLYLPFTLYGFGRNAPTPGRVRAEQDQLRLTGCQRSLVRALRAPSPRDASHEAPGNPHS